jgi:hypothetical protein
MKHERILLQSPDSTIKYHIGINDFHKRVTSYGKILYNNSILTYDEAAIYVLDKLHLTFSLSGNVKQEIADAYFNRKEINIDDCFILKPNYSHGNNYHYSFAVECEEVHFGYVHLCNTKTTLLCKIEIDNRLLYERSVMYLLARLFCITKHLNLKFHNINMIDIARDSPQQVYDSLGRIYYQSTKCNSVVHKLSGKVPEYGPVTKIKIHDYPDEDGVNGAFLLGSKKSQSQIRIYSKTSEIADNGFKKDYISEIHKQHFGREVVIERVEASISSNFFHGCGDLLNILPQKQLPHLFFKALGEKLTFKILTTRFWDKNNNDKHEQIRLIQVPAENQIMQCYCPITPTTIRFSHNNNLNKYKFKLTEYLDDEICFNELKRYINMQKEKQVLQVDSLVKAYAIVIRNYKNAIPKAKGEKLKSLIEYTQHGGKNLLIHRLCNYLRKLLPFI